MSIPLDLWNSILSASAEIKSDFDQIQQELNEKHESQQQIHQRQKNKNKK